VGCGLSRGPKLLPEMGSGFDYDAPSGIVYGRVSFRDQTAESTQDCCLCTDPNRCVIPRRHPICGPLPCVCHPVRPETAPDLVGPPLTNGYGIWFSGSVGTHCLWPPFRKGVDV